jgi:hypothetical protein
MSNASESRSPQIFFITFGAGNKEIESAANRLGKQALESGFFDDIEVLSASALPSHVLDLFSPVQFEETKGFGFWAWKPYVINRKIQSLLDGDVLVYLDAGFEINKNGSDRFTYYLDFVARNDFLVFPIPYQHRFWVKPHSALRIEVRDYFRNQVAAGFVMLRVSDFSRRIVARWYDLAFQDSGAALTDNLEEGQSPEKGFKEHRQDQSILTHIIFSENVQMLDRDETHHTPWEKGEEFPFLALRNKTGVSKLAKIFRKSRKRAFLRQVSSRLNFGYIFRMISKKYPLDKSKMIALFKRRFK